MNLFRVTYNRKGQSGQTTMTVCTVGIVSATELVQNLAQSWHLSNWSLQKVPFAKHTRRVLPRYVVEPLDQQKIQQ